ncbi:MAG: hypothetical protein ACI9RY_000798 [Reinekea sp.]|jgi:hypothetical protein
MKFSLSIALFVFFTLPFSFAEDGPVSAEPERWFQVEVLIFKNPPIDTDNPELWPVYADIQHPPAFIELEVLSDALTDSVDELDLAEGTPANAIINLDEPVEVAGLASFTALTEPEQQLLGARNTLARDSRYQILFHEAWNEPVPGRDEVIPIRIDGGKRFGRQFELQGYITLYVERYLHLSTDLHLIDYQESTDPFDLVESGDGTGQVISGLTGMPLVTADLLPAGQANGEAGQFFISVRDVQLIENRRMRSKEIHYLDNPEFGLLILITPIDSQ